MIGFESYFQVSAYRWYSFVAPKWQGDFQSCLMATFDAPEPGAVSLDYTGISLTIWSVAGQRDGVGKELLRPTRGARSFGTRLHVKHSEENRR